MYVRLIEIKFFKKYRKRVFKFLNKYYIINENFIVKLLSNKTKKRTYNKSVKIRIILNKVIDSCSGLVKPCRHIITNGEKI